MSGIYDFLRLICTCALMPFQLVLHNSAFVRLIKSTQKNLSSAAKQKKI